MDYSKGKIYKIIDNTNGNQYIGSTCCPRLSTRLAKHRCDYSYFLKQKYHYVTSFEILKNNDYDIVLLENCSSKNRDELRARERYYIETLECVNKLIPLRTHTEYMRYYRDKKKKETKAL